MKKQELVNEMQKFLKDIHDNKTAVGHVAETLVNILTTKINEKQSFKIVNRTCECSCKGDNHHVEIIFED